MSTKYLLPCSCGEPLLIDVGQAGQNLRCKCGRTVEAPTMRGIRQLQPAPAEDDSAGGAAARSWSRGHGVVFAIGVLTAVLALAVVAALLYQRTQLDTRDPYPNEAEMADAWIDELPVDESWDVWRTFRDQGPGIPQPAEHVLARRLHQQYTRLVYAALILCAAGAGAAASALLLGPRTSAGTAAGRITR